MIARIICWFYGHGDKDQIATKAHGRRKTLVFYCHRCNHTFERAFWTD